MKRTQIKDAIRNIGKKRISFISICFIVLLGVGSFLWASFIKGAIIKAASDYYREQKFSDVEMVCSLGVSGEEIEQIKTVEGVTAAEGVIQSDATLAFKNERKKLTALSLTSKVNVAKLIDGRLPEAQNECVLNEYLMNTCGISIGDKVRINSSTFALVCDEFTVTGKVSHPSSIRNGREDYAVFREDAFDREATKGLYAKAAVLIDVPENVNIFSKKYFNSIKKTADELDNLTGTLEFIRIKNEFATAISSGTDVENLGESIKQLPSAASMLNWVTVDRNSNVGYVDVSAIIKSMGSASGAFAALFLVVGAIVCFSTIAIIVNEQKKMIGATKAFGFYNKEVDGKYSIFGASATVIGLALGIVVAFVLEIGFLSMFENTYVFGVAAPIVDGGLTAVVFGVAIVLSVATTLFACKSVVKKPAAALMSGNDDQKKKSGSKVKGNSKGSVFSRLVARNMRSELSRVIVSIAIILGSVGIIGVGFTLKFGFDGMIAKEYTDVIKYDVKVSYSSADEEDLSRIEEIFKKYGADYVAAYEEGRAMKAGSDRETAMIISTDDESFTKFFALNSVKTGETMSIPDDGILVQRRFAEVNNLKIGDRISVYDKNLRERNIRVRGIFENYMGKYCVISKTAQKEILKESTTNNCYYVILNGCNKTALETEISTISDNLYFEDANVAVERFGTLSLMLNTSILGLTFVAILMSLIILTNLMNIFISKKMKDLAIMRINGFSIKETRSYLMRETLIMNIVGLASGFILGSSVAYVIIRIMEQPETHLVRSISVIAWLIALVVEAVFSFAISSVVFRKVKKLKPTDAI